MSSLTIPLHLLIPTAVSLGGLIFLLLKRNTLRCKNPAVYKSGMIFLFSYALIVGNALGHDIYYQLDLNRYDINEDGFFSPPEITADQLIAMERLANDDARNESFISAFIASGLLSVSVYIVKRISHALLESEENEDKENHTNTIHT